MFSKLLKYEWKQNVGLLGWLSVGALGAGVLGALVMKAIVFMGERMAEEDLVTLGITGLSSALGFIFLALGAYLFAVQFITLYRFYKNKFTDEGYLTFTLPVSTKQIFLSSFLNIMAWLVISIVVVAASVAMIIFIGASGFLKEYRVELQYLYQNIFGVLQEELSNEPGYGFYQVLNGITMCISPIYSVIVLMSSITIGSVLAKKHKILATIGIYYCINAAVGIVESVLAMVPIVFMFANYAELYYVYMDVILGLTLILQVGLCFGGYVLSTRLMRNKLNLP